MTDDGGFRLLIVSLVQTTHEAAVAQNIVAPNVPRGAKAEVTGSTENNKNFSYKTGKLLAELMVAAVLLRETTAPSRRVQIAFLQQDGTRLVADSLPDGLTRGLINPGEKVPSSGSTSSSARLEVTYTQPNGALHKGIVAVNEDHDISAAMMTYLQESEQILSTLALGHGTHPIGKDRNERAVWAIGFVVQLLPELAHEQLEAMTERLAANPLAGLLGDTEPPTPEILIDRLFANWKYTVLADSPIRFGCNCTRERFIAGLSTLAQTEIDAVIEEKMPLELRCDACGQTYSIKPSELKKRIDP